MPHHAFICYPTQNQDIVENLAGHLRDLGVSAWVYSLDRTLAKDVWAEIEEKINIAKLFLFVASPHTEMRRGNIKSWNSLCKKSINPANYLP